MSERRSNKNEDVIYRNVQEGEFNSLKVSSQFSQYEDSLEREKWFYREDANPGAGVNHKYKCTINLKAGSLDLLVGKNDKKKWEKWQDWKNWKEEEKGLANPKDISDSSTIVQKEGEPHCFGIHEDALPFFNNMVLKVKIVENQSSPSLRKKFSKNSQTIVFDQQKLPSDDLVNLCS